MLEPQGNRVLIQSSLFSDVEAKPWRRGSFNVLAFHGCVSIFPQPSCLPKIWKSPKPLPMWNTQTVLNLAIK